jgi:hypothetical protein
MLRKVKEVLPTLLLRCMIQDTHVQTMTHHLQSSSLKLYGTSYPWQLKKPSGQKGAIILGLIMSILHLSLMFNPMVVRPHLVMVRLQEATPSNNLHWLNNLLGLIF